MKTNPDKFEPSEILAKSDGKSLLGHIEDSLRIYRHLVYALPILPKITRLKNIFDLIFCAVYLHDWGKAHAEFQKILREEKKGWHYRHEIFSVPFVEMLHIPEEEKELITLAVLGHHRDYETIYGYYYSDEYIEQYRLDPVPGINPDYNENLRKRLHISYLKALRNRLQEYYDKYSTGNFQFKFRTIDFSNYKNPIEKIVHKQRDQTITPDNSKYWRQIILSASLKICDRMGSAEIEKISTLTPDNFTFLDKYKDIWYAHQKKCGNIRGSLFLTAPTGSGKTEAALLWIKKQLQTGHQGRIFYILPYTASINAMHKRLTANFEKPGAKPGDTEYIGIVHGKLSQYLAEYYENAEETQTNISKIKEIHRKTFHPLKIITPFQILKYCYGVKDFEIGFAELAGAMLIFDEIHAYDIQTFAQITASLAWMIKHLKIRVIIMTATLPAYMLHELQKAVGESKTVKAEESLMKQFTRHNAVILEGTIFDNIPSILRKLNQNKRIIVACNTVSNAQKIFSILNKEQNIKKSILLHSRFIAKDRIRKEKDLLRDKAEIHLLVGTQAIEVSLDIDFDILFTEPAPIDALIQRFGRINRKNRKNICPVYICSKGGENDHYIYPKDIVEKTLQVLASVSTIKEKELQNLIDTVYPKCPEEEKYLQIKKGFTESLSRLKPFMPHKENEKDFYEKFTGIPVVPVSFHQEYEKLIRESDFIRAERLSITLHRGIFHKLAGKNLITKNFVPIGKKGKKTVSYLQVDCKYDSDTGLSDQEEKNNNLLIL